MRTESTTAALRRYTRVKPLRTALHSSSLPPAPPPVLCCSCCSRHLRVRFQGKFLLLRLTFLGSFSSFTSLNLTPYRTAPTPTRRLRSVTIRCAQPGVWRLRRTCSCTGVDLSGRRWFFQWPWKEASASQEELRRAGDCRLSLTEIDADHIQSGLHARATGPHHELAERPAAIPCVWDSPVPPGLNPDGTILSDT